MKIGKVFASAGCGKTTRLLSITETIFASGVRPEEVMFTTFTRSGAYEAQERAIKKFDYHENQFLYFRTLHSIAYRACGCPNVMSFRDYVALGRALGCRFGSAGSYADLSESGKGDAMLALYNLDRNQGVESLPSDHGCTFSLQDYVHFKESYDAYKSKYGKYDYTDLIEEAATSASPLPIRYAIVDEAQDLTQLQWRAIKNLATNADWLWLAGDDDQSIYTYSGADPNILIDLRADQTIHLETSYRLPPALSAYANSIAKRISKREPKTIRPRAAEGQCLEYTNNFRDIEINKDDDVVVLVRNRVVSKYVAEELLANGHLYINNCDSDDFFAAAVTAAHVWNRLFNRESVPCKEVAACLPFIPAPLWRKNHRKVIKEDRSITLEELVLKHRLMKYGPWQEVLTEIPHADFLDKKWDGTMPRININTIHTFKGKEVDHAIVVPDMTYQTWKSFQKNPDQEHRTFFVAVTRSRRKMTIVRPITDKAYPL